MKARHGKSVILDSEGIACAAAAAAFGFRPLPEGLRSGKGLVGFGIVSDEAVGKGIAFIIVSFRILYEGI
jgi:uncharacterized protein (DUF169 family)